MMISGIIEVYRETQAQQVGILCGKIAEFVNLNVGGKCTRSYRCAVNGKSFRHCKESLRRG
jgi:hypothetical protein